MARFTHPFKPIIFPDSSKLILGTFPSLDSFSQNFYYAHKRNQFWKILALLYHQSCESQEEKIALLKSHHLALWDVVESCERKNSSDSNLKKPLLQDIPALLQNYPAIKQIYFTGQKAHQLYHKKFSTLDIETVVLPSPSPAYAKMRFEEKCEQYRVLLS